ncbi:cation:proton antiporter [Streptomyces sp. ODS28]|uniref:cation:proton antiporter n=1 Tax=Streptomyces sp. ODS28 TaxID=3136688 RepID=UPI0031E726E0
MTQSPTLILIMAVAALTPLLAHGAAYHVRVPLVICELVLGILIGPHVLGWAQQDEVIDTLSELGLSMLIFTAGYEIEFAAIRGAVLRRASVAWVLSLALGLGVGLALTAGDGSQAVVIGTALTSTALGTVLPMLRESGELGERFGKVVMAFGAVGEFGPIIAMAVLLGGRAPGTSAAVLAVFAAVTAAAVWWALRPRPSWFSRIIRSTLHTSGQFAVRFVMLVLVAMLALSQAFGLDVLLGAFVAGVLTRLVFLRAAPESSGEVLGKVEAMGFGFLVPLFYIVTGIKFDLAALLGGGRALLLLPAFLVLFLLVRGLPAWLLAPRDLRGPDRGALALYSSTCLPLVVAITTIGVDEGVLGRSEAASLVGAAMISVLVFPLLTVKLRPRQCAASPGQEYATESESW